MTISRKQFLTLLAGTGLAAAAGCAKSDSRVKVGFIVKQPEEPWFQNE